MTLALAGLFLCAPPVVCYVPEPHASASAEFRSDFVRVLRSRRRPPAVSLTVEPAKPVKHPLYQGNVPLGSREAMESCPRKKIKDFKEKLVEENFYLITESGEQGRVPVLILSLKDETQERRPAIVFLHSSYKCKEWLRPLLEAYASRGYVSIAIDSRYHGERANNKTTYIDALISAWRNGDTMPFIYDTVWDLIKLGDYITRRKDVDSSRIGITGESLGEARIDLGRSVIDKEVVKRVWDRIAPGLDSQFDSPHSVPVIAPRPLLLLNGAEDPRCPLPGLETPVSRTSKAYQEAGFPKKFKFVAEPGIGHLMTAKMVKEASDWFDEFL